MIALNQIAEAEQWPLLYTTAGCGDEPRTQLRMLHAVHEPASRYNRHPVRDQGMPGTSMKESRQPKLLDRVREALRARRYNPRTEDTYVQWIHRNVLFHNVRHPAQMGEFKINASLTHPAVKEKVSASTQNQSLSALLFGSP